MSRDFFIGAIAGIIVGAAGVYAATSSTPSASTALDVPSEAEATAAMRREKAAAFPNLTLKLGQCDKDAMSSGVRCTVDVDFAANGKSKPAIVGFSRGPSGWVSVHYL